MNKKRHKTPFKTGQSVILVKDLYVRPKMSLEYFIPKGQRLKVKGQGWHINWGHEELSEPTPWVSCNGINPDTNKKWGFNFSVDIYDLIPDTEANRLLYASQV